MATECAPMRRARRRISSDDDHDLPPFQRRTSSSLVEGEERQLVRETDLERIQHAVSSSADDVSAGESIAEETLDKHSTRLLKMQRVHSSDNGDSDLEPDPGACDDFDELDDDDDGLQNERTTEVHKPQLQLDVDEDGGQHFVTSDINLPGGAVPEEYFADDGESDVSIARSKNTQVLENDGLLELVDAVLGADFHPEDAKTLKGLDEEERATMAYQVLAVTDPDILESIVGGHFTEKIRSLPNMKKLLQEMRVRTMNDTHPQPAIYANILVDSAGRSLTPTQLYAMLQALETYIDGTDGQIALKIDRFRPPAPLFQAQQASYTHRKYLMTAKRKGQQKRSDAKERNLKDFIIALRSRLDVIDVNDHDKPLREPLIEIGYTHKSTKRLNDHQAHRSSNYCMNIVEAICGVLWPGRFKIMQFVVFLCTSADNAVIAEILFTRLAQGYTHGGGGFSYFAAGRSNRSALQYTTRDWEEFFNWSASRIDVVAIHEKEKARWLAQVTDSTDLTDVIPPEFEALGLTSLEPEYLEEVRSDLQRQVDELMEEQAADEEEQFAWLQHVAREVTGHTELLKLAEERRLLDADAEPEH